MKPLPLLLALGLVGCTDQVVKDHAEGTALIINLRGLDGGYIYDPNTGSGLAGCYKTP